MHYYVRASEALSGAILVTVSKIISLHPDLQGISICNISLRIREPNGIAYWAAARPICNRTPSSISNRSIYS